MRPIDADTLTEKCQELATEAWQMKITAKVETVMNQFIDFIDAEPTIGINGWISVEDKLPDKDGKYLIAIKGTIPYIDTAWFRENLCDNPQFEYEGVPEVPGFYNGDGEGDWIVKGVTHWMPLPEVPKEGN